ncbi:phosphopantetheine-binding protein [Paenibacillus sp. NPDC057967]|uniref:phosphopantetheine-binding protein n=1 Tax=Paenibacillus sp. NPDC057967 TaxID=3346293 RepID=UPI0036D92197
MDIEIVAVLQKHIILPPISETDMLHANLSDYGLDSLKTINLILDIEEHFDIEIPDDMLSFDNISTIYKIKQLISQLE